MLERVKERVTMRAFLSLRHLHTFFLLSLPIPFLEGENEKEHVLHDSVMIFDKLAFVF